MFKLKNFKRKFVQSNSEKYSLSENDDKSYSTSAANIPLEKNQVILLAEWLDQLNRENLITLTDQNDIVIMAGGKNDQNQQIFINCNDIDIYMETNMVISNTKDKYKIISMLDLAQILLKFRYVNESSGQLSFSAHTITMDSKELQWLTSIICDAKPDPKSYETQVRLFDGENTELLYIPYEHMNPTNDIRIVANYLFRNGNVRYDVNNGTYAYRYVKPDILLDEKTKSPERIKQHQFLSFHIQKIHVDQQNKHVELQFRYEFNHNLILPNHWYHQILNHHFDRDYIIDILLANGGVINQNAFVFMGRTYSLQPSRINKYNSTSALSTNYKTINLSSKEKNDLIHQYIELIIQNDGTKLDETNQLFVLENYADGRKLYFTPEHTKFIRQNQFKRQDVIYILVQNGQIKQDQYGNWLLDYNNQYIRLPSSLISSSTVNQPIPPSIQQIFSPDPTTMTKGGHSEAQFLERYRKIIDYMCRHGLIIWDKPSKVIRLHFSDQTLLLPIDHLRSIIDPNVVSSSSTSDGALPFTSRQLSQWLINNSYITRKTQ